MKSPVEKTPKPKVTEEQTNEIADFLLKATVFINKAYAAVRKPLPVWIVFKIQVGGFPEPT